uniref:Uncharacterized protein n=1 Tax=Vitis vinifera TaxID=29760 RepID=A5AZX5_VITVI|nr:hypothetical protein VITISV_003234 [Vitis vinifera]
MEEAMSSAEIPFKYNMGMMTSGLPKLVIFRVDGIRYKMPRAEIAALSELQGQHLVDLGIKATECFVDLGLKAPEKHSVEEILNEYSCWKTQKNEYADLLTLIEKNFIHSYELNQLKRLESAKKAKLKIPRFLTTYQMAMRHPFAEDEEEVTIKEQHMDRKTMKRI